MTYRIAYSSVKKTVIDGENVTSHYVGYVTRGITDTEFKIYFDWDDLKKDAIEFNQSWKARSWCWLLNRFARRSHIKNKYGRIRFRVEPDFLSKSGQAFPQYSFSGPPR